MWFLGNISYSSYLLHFPLQMIVVMLARTSPRPLLIQRFLVHGAMLRVLIILSLARYYYFEAPCDVLRMRWLSKRVKEQK